MIDWVHQEDRRSTSLPLVHPSPCHHLSLLLRRPQPLVLPPIPPPHQRLIPRPLPPLPIPLALPPNDAPPTKGTALDPIILLPRAPPTNHPIRPLIDMVLDRIMALVARIHLGAAREAEPAVAAAVVGACTLPGQLVAGVQAELLLPAARATCGW